MKRPLIYRWLRFARGSESGQALVELSVAGSLLILLLLGAIEFGQVAYSSIEVSNAAKAGVQYGAQNQGTASDTPGIQSAAASAATDLTITFPATPSPNPSCQCSDGSRMNSSCSTIVCPASTHIVETLTVKTQAVVTPMIRLPGFSGPFTLNGQATQKCGR
jgi:Flp pilus assembly protein TadG